MSSDLAERILAELAEIRHLLTERAPMEDRSLATGPAARYLGLHDKTLSKLRRSGSIAGYRSGPGGHWHYRLTELDRYRASLTADSKPRAALTRNINWAQ